MIRRKTDDPLWSMWACVSSHWLIRPSSTSDFIHWPLHIESPQSLYIKLSPQILCALLNSADDSLCAVEVDSMMILNIQLESRPCLTLPVIVCFRLFWEIRWILLDRKLSMRMKRGKSQILRNELEKWWIVERWRLVFPIAAAHNESN